MTESAEVPTVSTNLAVGRSSGRCGKCRSQGALGNNKTSRVAAVDEQRRFRSALHLDVDVGVTNSLSPKVATYPDDTHLRANSAARHMSPSHCISASKAWSDEQPVCFVMLFAMGQLKDCVAGGTA